MVSIKNRGVRLKSAFILLTSLLLSIFGSSESTVIRTSKYFGLRKSGDPIIILKNDWPPGRSCTVNPFGLRVPN